MGLTVLQRGVEQNPKSFDMVFEYGWTLFDRAHDYYPAAEQFYRATQLKSAKPYAARLHYRCFEHLMDFDRLWPALAFAHSQFPNDANHQRLVRRDTDWWKKNWNDPREHRRQIILENTHRRQRGLDPYLYPNDPYWNVCPLCGMATKKDKAVCENCGQYNFVEKRIVPLQ